MSSLSMFRERFVEFASVTDARVNLWLGIAGKRISSIAFGTYYADAALLLTAHFLQLSLEREAAAGGAKLGPGGQLIGPISSVTTDKLSMSSGGLSGRRTMSDDYFSLSEYGLAFLAIRDMIVTSPLVMNGRYSAQIFSNATVPEES